MLQPWRASASLPFFSKSLFPLAWGGYARFEQLGLQIRTGIPIVVKVFRQWGREGPEQVSEHAFAPGHSILALPTLSEAGSRLFYSLHGIDQASLPDKSDVIIDWVCDRAPEHAVHLAVVICTRDREIQIQTLLDQIDTQREDLTTCVIVNQGATGLHERLTVREAQKYLFVEQENFGGAAGFTRGIIEALNNPHITHVVLMDDDVEIDSGVLCRIRFALAYIPPEICIGGVMVDRDCRQHLLSVGHDFDSRRAMTTDRLVRRDLHLEDDMARSLLEYPLNVGFCGWWCFCFPRQVVETCGLPLPLFLRGDDAEYGLRLKRAGFPTVMWPGIYVAHPNLQNQTRPWHNYYDRRNALICALLERGIVSSKAIMRLMRGVFNALALYRYAEARASLDALRAYLGGADSLECWNENIHRARVNDDEMSKILPAGNLVFLAIHRTSFVRTVVTILRVCRDIFSLGWGKTTISNDSILQIDEASWMVGTVQRPERIQVVSGRNVTELRRDPSQARNLFFSMLRILWFTMTHLAPKPEDFLRLSTPVWWSARLETINRKSKSK